MRQRTLTTGILIMVLACGCSHRKAAPNTPEEEARERVEEIYSHVMRVYAEADSTLDADSTAVFDSRYLSSDFLDLNTLVDSIDALYYPDEAGFRDYDHWIMGNDWRSPSFSVDTTYSSAPNSVCVRITLKDMDRTCSVDLPMVKEDGMWKIDDFIGHFPEPGSEKESMKRYIDEEHEADTD